MKVAIKNTEKLHPSGKSTSWPWWHNGDCTADLQYQEQNIAQTGAVSLLNYRINYF